jgi:hypothetical protein
MLVLAVLIAPFAHCASAVNAQIPVIDFVLVIFKAVHIGITVIKVLDACALYVDIRIIPAMVLIPVITAVSLQESIVLPSFNLGAKVVQKVLHTVFLVPYENLCPKLPKLFVGIVFERQVACL